MPHDDVCTPARPFALLMMVLVVVSAAGTLGGAGCSRGRTAAAAGAAPATSFDPVGRYDYTSVANGQNISGTITISRGGSRSS